MGTVPYQNTTENKKIDMICQHKADGAIIPLKIRMQDDDGFYQEYKIKAYKDLSHKGNFFNLPDAGPVSKTIYPFECKIEIFGREKIIRLYYSSFEHTWMLAPGEVMH